MPELVSTRDAERITCNYEEAVINGLAPDGGLYIPIDAEYPKFTTDELKHLSGQPYEVIFNSVKARLTGGEIPGSEQERMTAAAYGSSNFPDVAGGNVVPVRQVKDNLYIENVSLGPTGSFKDMPLQPLAQDIGRILNRKNTQMLFLGATSGDTGSSAEKALGAVDAARVVILSPEEGMADVQKAQMGVLSGGNVHNVSIRGSFDDCQDLVKEINALSAFSETGAVNSINWGRIVAQVPYYVAGYLQVMGDKCGEEVDFVVPTGNFGNILSGHIARKMGVPVRHMIAATNENNVVHNLIQTGVYQRNSKQTTSSPSMDITKASNYERLVYEVMQGDAELVASYMGEFNQHGKAALAAYGIENSSLKDLGFASGTSTHQNRLESIRRIYDGSGSVIDPHTADAVTVALQMERDIPAICMETALPFKFESTIKAALGSIPKRPERFIGLEDELSGNEFTVIDNSVEELQVYLQSIAG